MSGTKSSGPLRAVRWADARGTALRTPAGMPVDLDRSRYADKSGRTLLWDYERDGLGALTVIGSSCTLAPTTLNGVPCVKVTGTSAGGTTYTRISLGSKPITLTGGVGMDCAAERANTTQLTARIGPGSSVPDYASASLNPTAASNTSFWTYNDVQEYSIQAFPNGTGFAYGGTWTTPPTYPTEAGYAEVRANAVAGQIPVWYLRRVYSMAPRVSRVALVLDDGYATAYRLLKPVLESYKLRASWAIIPSEIDGGTALFMTWADVANLFDQGHEIVTHGTTAVSGAGSVGAFMATVRAQRQRIRDLGFATARSDRCYVWPGGEHQTAVNDTAYRDAMRAEGFVIGRGAMPHTIAWTADTIPEPLVLPIIGHTQAGSSGAEATNISGIVGAINQAAATGTDLIVMNHAGVPSSDTSWGSNGALNIRTTDYATICAAIRANVVAGMQAAVQLGELA